jgi:hypothetical protein
MYRCEIFSFNTKKKAYKRVHPIDVLMECTYLLPGDPHYFRMCPSLSDACMYVYEFLSSPSQKPMLKSYSIVVYLNSFQLKSVSFRDTKNCSNVDQTGDMTSTGSLRCSHNK